MSLQSLMHLLLPEEEPCFQESIRSRTFVFCSLIAWVGGVYAMVKWGRLGHPIIPYTSIALVVLSSALLVANKYSLLLKSVIGHITASLVI